MKTLLLLLGSLFLINEATCQVDDRLSRLSNDSIKYDIVRVSPKFIGINKVTAPQTLVGVNIKEDELTLLKKVKRHDWLTALNDPKRDWAANLVLYALYKKDATIFTVRKNREDWVGTAKSKDIDFWKKKLK